MNQSLNPWFALSSRNLLTDAPYRDPMFYQTNLYPRYRYVTFILPRRIDEFSSRFSRYYPIEGDRGMGSAEDGRFIAFSKESCTLFSRKERNNVPYPFRCTMVSISSLIRVVCYFVSNAWITQIVRVVQACTKRLKMEKIRNCNRKWISCLRL